MSIPFSVTGWIKHDNRVLWGPRYTYPIHLKGIGEVAIALYDKELLMSSIDLESIMETKLHRAIYQLQDIVKNNFMREFHNLQPPVGNRIRL